MTSDIGQAALFLAAGFLKAFRAPYVHVGRPATLGSYIMLRDT